MTLTTTIYLFPKKGNSPDVDSVWHVCAVAANFPMEIATQRYSNENEDVISPLGVGADALIKVINDTPVSVLLDTAYSGNPCDVHNYIISALINAYLQDCHIVANNEFTGEWFVNQLPYDIYAEEM